MKLTEELMYNAIVLYHANKKGWDMKKDLNKILSQKNMSVSKMLNMTWEKFLKTNANEVMGTEQVGFGKEFVEEKILAAELIERLETNWSLLARTVIRQMWWKVVDYPVKWAKVRMIKTTEATDSPLGWATDQDQVKKAPTAQITLTAVEMVITIYYSDTWLEDSVIGVAEYILWAIADAYETSIHQVLINGDTTTWLNANINIIDWNTSALADWDKTDFLTANWGRKLALANSWTVDAWTNLAIENIRSARALMWVKWLNPDDLALIPDTQTYFELMNLTEVETIEKFGDAATIKNGRLVALDWIEIVNREELGRALATWNISATPASNTFGQILIMHMPSVNVWIRRNLTTELSRYAEDRASWVTWSARIAVTLDNTQNNNEATLPAALIRNI